MSLPRLSARGWGLIGLSYVVAIALGLASWSIPGLADLERLAYDLRLSFAAEAAPQDTRILLVPFDESTAAATRHRSPLDRRLLAHALARLDGLAPRAIGIDILFDQPTSAADDNLLAETIAALRTPTFIVDDSGEASGLLTRWQHDNLHAYFDRFGSSVQGGASGGLVTDADGTVRHTPSLVAATLPDRLANAFDGSARTAELPINFRRAAGADDLFARLPILTVASADPAALPYLRQLVRRRIVLVGAELDDVDRHRTPLSIHDGSTAAGLDIQAETLATLLDTRAPGAWLSLARWSLALLLPALGILLGTMRLSATLRLLIAIGVPAVIVICAWAWELVPGIQTYGLPVIGEVGSWLLTGLTAAAVSAVAVNEERQIAREISRRYLPVGIADQIARRPELLAVHGKRVPLAILFTDLAGFTSLSEVLTPEVLSSVLNSYLDGMTEAAQRHGATLDKFIGDAVVCFWGAPVAADRAAEQALRAGLAMQAFARAHRIEMAKQDILVGATRIGAHYGDAIVGNFGSSRRVQYTAIGDAMNLAARLESANKHLGTEFIASGDIIDAAGWTLARDIGTIAVKGRHKPVRVFQLDASFVAADIEDHHRLVERLRKISDEPLGSVMTDPALASYLTRVAHVGTEGVWTLDSK